MIKYRPDIDGLRALAVLAVVGFHAEIGALRGGFAGVDVFFVVSGYLITGIIFSALERGTFSYREFYTRRINRIFPALMVAIAATLALGWPILYPGEFANLGHQAFGGAAFVSNFFLWSEAGYFDSLTKPLLHLWSLGVEEQFYLLWPVVAVVGWRWRWNMKLLLVLIISVSFFLNIFAIDQSYGVAAFYSPFTRFWEILSGGLLCVLEFKRDDRRIALISGRVARESASVAGVILLVAALVLVNSATPWPGWHALLPVVGTSLLIAAGKDATLNRRVLCNKSLVAIGLISYPLYLWHWPLMVYSRLLYGGQLPRLWRVGLILVSLVLAAATYQLVEKPIRFGRHKRRSALRLVGAMAAVAAIALMVRESLLRARLDTGATSAIERAATDKTEGGAFIDGGREVKVFTIEGARRGADIVFVGDSHAAQYKPRFEALSHTAKSVLGRVDFITYGGCPPLPGVNHRGMSWDRAPFRCDFIHNKGLELINGPRVRTVVYSAFWEAYFDQSALYLAGDKAQSPIALQSREADSVFSLFERELQKLRRSGKTVFVILSNPSSPHYDPYSMLPPRLSSGTATPKIIKVSRDSALARREPIAVRLRAIAAKVGAHVIDPADYLCTSSECPAVDRNGVPLYRDDHHLRASFVRSHASFLDQLLNY